MSKLLLLQGLPASGKSTKAAQLLADYGNAVRINRDLLRTMLHRDVWTGKKEGMTRHAARTLARAMLKEAGVVIIDDTNLAAVTVESWKQLAQEEGATFEIHRMDTSMDECLRRDCLRDKPVGNHVIIGMALQHGLCPRPEQGIVLCDIDGTLADISHRRHFLAHHPKDWKGFFDAMMADTVRQDVLTSIQSLFIRGCEVVFVSGRPDTYRAMTEAWLTQECHWVMPLVFMRRAHDTRPDHKVKAEMLRTYFPDRTWIHCVFDDRPSVIRMWRDQGLQVVDVGTGEEF